jgi:uncharacterized protein (TIGR02246 family)
VAVFGVAFLMMASPAEADDASAPSNVSSIRSDQRNEELIRKMYADFTAAWNTHDARAMSLSYTHDGDHVEPDGTIAKGREGVEALLAKQHASVFKTSQLELTIEDVWFITADVALIDGTYTLAGARLPDGTDLGTRTGRITAVFLKERGEWAIAASRLMIPTKLPYKKG